MVTGGSSKSDKAPDPEEAEDDSDRIRVMQKYGPNQNPTLLMWFDITRMIQKG